MSEIIENKSEEENVHVLKPTSATVFGIICIFWALWGLIGIASSYIMRYFLPMNEMQQKMMMPFTYEVISVSINLILQIYLLTVGIMLLKASLQAVKAFLIYCISVIIITPIMTIGTSIFIFKGLEGTPASGLATLILVFSISFGLIIALAFPIVGLIFMTRPKVKELYTLYNNPANMANPANHQSV